MCQAYGCSNKSGKGKKRSFFQIPNPDIERERCAKWINNIGTDKFYVKTYKFNANRVVCEDHFEQQCFEDDVRAKVMGYAPTRKLLKPDAVPTIFLHRRIPGERQSTKKRKQRTERENVSPLTVTLIFVSYSDALLFCSIHPENRSVHRLLYSGGRARARG